MAHNKERVIGTKAVRFVAFIGAPEAGAEHYSEHSSEYRSARGIADERKRLAGLQQGSQQAVDGEG
jgi:hypothetical protein